MTKSYETHKRANTRRVCDWQIGVCVDTSGEMLKVKCKVDKPMPGIVILVHGVNDIGEAFPTQEQGIIAGLNQRLGRCDMHPHEWQDSIIKHYGYRDGKTKVYHNVRSPVIPFYWGYKPVDHAEWVKDQARYAAEIDKLNAVLPYDSYVENDPNKQQQFGMMLEKVMDEYDIDCFGNVLMPNQARGGGTFANATTNIPDMLGPGFAGFTRAIAEEASTSGIANDGDYTHAVYKNPHRIYQFFAAQRLAEIIVDIRNNETAKTDTINIVAHSQGTIISMLANMLVKQQGFDPADCVIFNHSPYSLTDNTLENWSAGQHQSTRAREQTLKNFCALMATNKQYGRGEYHDEAYSKTLTDSCCVIPGSPWCTDEKSRRNNFGKVYNYFCPSDGVVSLSSIQGFGWRGIPKPLALSMANLRQRVFYDGASIGEMPSAYPFQHPASWGKGHYYHALNVNYDYHDVVANGEALPQAFTFALMGADDLQHPYYQPVTGRDWVFAFAAKADIIYRSAELMKQRALLMKMYGIDGMARNPNDFLTKNPLIKISQHSAIVMNQQVSQYCVAYDLAVGYCEAFYLEQGNFWRKLLLKADWRHRDNRSKDTRIYYRSGVLNEYDTKQYMNRPDEVLPKGEFGVVNEYTAGTTYRYDKRMHRRVPIAMQINHLQTVGQVIIGADTTQVELPQWEWPKPLTEQEIRQEQVAEQARQRDKEYDKAIGVNDNINGNSGV